MMTVVQRFQKRSVWLLSAFALAAVAMLLVATVARAEFGVSSLVFKATQADGTTLVTQAGSHPADVTTAFELNRDGEGEAIGNVKNVHIDLPAGFIGNPLAVPQCSWLSENNYLRCRSDSQVGTVGVTISAYGFLFTLTEPVYNMRPHNGHVADFALSVVSIRVDLGVSLRTDGDYGVSIDARNTSDLVRIEGVSTTLWGVPADPSHDADRGGPSNAPVVPFLSLPSDCGSPLQASMTADSWQAPGQFAPVVQSTPIALTGCEDLAFAPSLTARPAVQSAGTPTGLKVDLHVPQNETVGGLSEAALREATVTLPAGVAINPSQANGLTGCALTGAEGVNLASTGPAGCPDSSKIGSVEIDTPLLASPLEGGVYLAQQGNVGAAQGSNPFNSLLALYIVAEGPGIRVKLPGEVSLDPATGQITARFAEDPITGSLLPQLPFGDFKLAFFGGPRAALVSPGECGTYTTTSLLVPWGGGAAVSPGDSFQITSGCSHGFSPGLVAGTQNNRGGAFSPFVLDVTRADGEQTVGSITAQTPPGMLGILKSVPLCPDAQAASGGCGAESQIGDVTVTAGAGPHPYPVTGGKVFLTGPYKGAPFGLSIVVPAVAGPFNLGTVVVRASIAVDPHTAQLTITSDALPSVLQGIPLQIKTVAVNIDRAGFTFNPTSCEPLAVNASIASTQGTSATASSRFQAADCASLPFAPKLAASSPAKTSRTTGAALDVKVGYPSGTQANIHSVAVTLPKQLPARLSTIQLACPSATFESNPASCGEGSLVGSASATTPVFANALTGPAYLVSHGGESFPDLVLVLQGEGVTIQLVGNVFINKAGVTSATFAHVPDAPISSFELNLPEGPHSALSAVGSLCAGALTMPTTITGQNGAVVKQTTKIAVSGCPKAKKKPKKHKKKHHKKKHKKGSAGGK